MEDFERYGDYNEYEEDMPKGKNPIAIILKVLVGVVCFAVVGVLVFRMVLFDYYPDSMKNIYFNDTLSAYYTATDGNIGAKTQKLRAPYDDPDKGRFFCDNLIVISGADQLQLSVRFNTSLVDTIYEDYGVTIDPDADNLFSFRLVRNPVDEDSKPTVIGELSYTATESCLMYRYYKLVFDGVDFGLDEGENKVNWIRLEVFLNGVEMKEPYMVAVYENNELFSAFEDYIPTEEELAGR